MSILTNIVTNRYTQSGTSLVVGALFGGLVASTLFTNYWGSAANKSSVTQDAYVVQKDKINELTNELNKGDAILQKRENELNAQILTLKNSVQENAEAQEKLTLELSVSEKRTLALEKENRNLRNLKSQDAEQSRALSQAKAQIKSLTQQNVALSSANNNGDRGMRELNENYNSLWKSHEKLKLEILEKDKRINQISKETYGEDLYSVVSLQPLGLGKKMSLLSVPHNKLHEVKLYNLSIITKRESGKLFFRSSIMSEFVEAKVGDYIILKDVDEKTFALALSSYSIAYGEFVIYEI